MPPAARPEPEDMMTSMLHAWRELDGASHRAELYRMWHLAASAGFTVPRALESVGARQSEAVERTRRWLLDDARRGRSVQESVLRANAPFTGFERGLLSLGSESGRLDDTLRLLADFHERRQRAMLAVRKRLAYPLFTAICASFIAPVPLLVTGHAAAYLSVALAAVAFWLFAGGAVVHWAAARHARAPAHVRARLARALATAVQAGLPLDRALRLSVDAADDPYIRRFVGALDDRRLATQPLAQSLSGCPHLGPEFLAVVANAERTGDFSGTLSRLADLYEDGFR